MKKLIFTITIGLFGMSAHAKVLPKETNFKRVVDSLTIYQGKLIKSEFESVADYKKRIDGLKKLSDTLYFTENESLGPFGSSCIDKKYNAETQTFTVTNTVFPTSDQGNIPITNYLLRSVPYYEDEGESKLVGVAGYVTDNYLENLKDNCKSMMMLQSRLRPLVGDNNIFERNVYCIVAPNFLIDSFSFDVKVPKEIAKLTNFGVMFKCVIKNTHVLKGLTSKYLDSGYERRRYIYYLIVDVVEVYIFDKKTKKIVYEIK